MKQGQSMQSGGLGKRVQSSIMAHLTPQDSQKFSKKPTSDGLQPNIDGLQPPSDGRLQPTSDGLQPNSEDLQPT